MVLLIYKIWIIIFFKLLLKHMKIIPYINIIKIKEFCNNSKYKYIKTLINKDWYGIKFILKIPITINAYKGIN